MSPTKTWVVYLHENRVNGKKYIGITSQIPERRWQNGEGYKGSSRFYSAIKHYGWDGFRHEILYTGLTQDDAERLEIELIAKYGTTECNKGYNLASGGHSPRVSPTTRKKLSEAKSGEKSIWWGKPAWNRGVRASEATKEKLRLAHGGSNHHMYGKHHSESTRAKISASLTGKQSYVRSDETRKKLSESLRGRTYSTETVELIREASHKRRVRCVETGRIYPSIRDAQRATGIDRSTISRCCQGKQKTAGGYHWEYYDDTPIFDTQVFAGKEVKENDR